MSFQKWIYKKVKMILALRSLSTYLLSSDHFFTLVSIINVLKLLAIGKCWELESVIVLKLIYLILKFHFANFDSSIKSENYSISFFAILS